MTALVNRAYKTLKDPVARALYWLELHGESLGRDNERVPPALAARVFEVQEQLEELRAARKAGTAAEKPGTTAEKPGTAAGKPGPADAETRALTGVRDELRADLEACGDRLAANFERTDATPGNGNAAAALTETKKILSELHYVRTLMRDVEKEL
jgi:molecular chaperone HscB